MILWWIVWCMMADAQMFLKMMILCPFKQKYAPFEKLFITSVLHHLATSQASTAVSCTICSAKAK